MRSALLATAAACALLLTGCHGSAGRCTANEQCGQQGVCLPVGTCAAKCDSSASCGGGEKCSAGGGCIAAGACGADPDCTGALLCSVGSCQAKCTGTGQGSCLEGQLCTGDGHCIDPGGSGGGAGGGGGSSCGGELFSSTRVQANFLIVLDHSGSMMDKVAGSPKWSTAVSALTTVTSQYQTDVRFGLNMFSTASMSCDPGQAYVPISDNAAAQIAAAFPATADGKGTPVAAALSIAGQNPGLKDPARASFVLLVTDGMENCHGNPVDQVKAMAAQGIKTYVVGFGNEVDAQNLANMAIAGGTARNAMPRYYQADDATGLNTAFSSIAAGAVGCDFKLTKTPPDPSKIFVSINGQLVPHDPNRHAGWEYTPGTDRVTLYGPACDVVVANPGAQVSLVYGCPDPTLTGGDGGYAFPTDGGDLIN